MKNDFGAGLVLGCVFGVSFLLILSCVIPEYTSYEVNGKQYIVTKKGNTFIKTDSIEITTANGILTIKEKN